MPLVLSHVAVMNPFRRRTNKPDVIYCARCGAMSTPAPSHCWQCEEPLVAGPGPKQLPFNFSIATLMLATTLVALVFGVIATNPYIGGYVALILTAVSIQTITLVRRRQQAGEHFSTIQKARLIGVAFATLVAMVAVTMSALAAGVATFGFLIWGAAEGEMKYVAGGVASGAACLAASYAAHKLNAWMRKKRENGELPF